VFISALLSFGTIDVAVSTVVNTFYREPLSPTGEVSL
jgi:hypothetical protein